MSTTRRIHCSTGGVAALLAATAPLVFVCSTPGYAQIEEVTVTTRKREENLQEVPLAVTAITADQIERQGISDLDDIASKDPSVQFDTAFGPADTRITIRGLSNTRGRSNVAFLVDGIDLTTENLNAAGSGLLANRRLLSDVERIEVIKGPQSALYGRAAFSGAISYITKNPGDEFEGKMNVELGDYGEQQFGLNLSGPVIDGVLGLRFSSIWYANDGFYTNSVSGEPVNDTNGEGYALTAVFTPTDELRFKLRGEYSQEDVGPLANVRLGGGRQGFGLSLSEYPAAGLAAGLGQNGQYIPASNGNPASWDATSASTSTALINFGQYCPDELKDPTKGPGICEPTNLGSGKGKVVAQSEDPRTGRDFVGTRLETFRVALETSLDVGVGSLTAYTGFTDFQGDDTYDQDWQAVGRPDRLLGSTWADSEVDTTQLSSELRFASQLDGPLQFTLGTLFWTETRSFDDRGGIIFCTLTRRAGGGPTETTLISDPRDFCNGQGGSLDNWQDYYLQLQPQVAGNWRAQTDSWSFYGVLEWKMTEDWTLTFEDRYVSETFDFTKPNQSSCSQFFGPNPGQVVLAKEIFDANGTLINNQVCSVEAILSADPDFDIGGRPPALSGTPGFRFNRASTSSHFDTPKITLQWLPSESVQLFFSWARAVKPGGIAATPGGGAPVSVEEDRFDPEKMTAWELGAKTDWQAAGDLRVNLSGFFQDYTDKQVNTQVLQEGFLSPRVLNAAAAQVWGLETDITWVPDFVQGLVLQAAYTYLDPTYTDFENDTANIVRAATIGEGCNVVYKGGLGPNPDDLTDPRNKSPFCRLDLSGKQLERTPKEAFTAGLTLTRPFLDTAFNWSWGLSGNYQSRRYLEVDNTQYLGSYWMADTSIGLQSEKLDILVYVDNLFDDDTIKNGGSGPDFGQQVTELGFSAGLGLNQFFGSLPPPRQFGLRGSYKF